MDLPDLAALCTEWQARLSLRDWRIAVKAGDAHSMGQDGVKGTVEFDACERAARIEVLLTDLKDPIAPHDPECVLVHELLHVLFMPFQAKKDASPKGLAQEQAINAIAGALVRLKRAGTEAATP